MELTEDHALSIRMAILTFEEFKASTPSEIQDAGIAEYFDRELKKHIKNLGELHEYVQKQVVSSVSN